MLSVIVNTEKLNKVNVIANNKKPKFVNMEYEITRKDGVNLKHGCNFDLSLRDTVKIGKIFMLEFRTRAGTEAII